MSLTVLDKGDMLCVVMKGRAGHNGESSQKADLGLGIKNDLSQKDE